MSDKNNFDNEGPEEEFDFLDDETTEEDSFSSENRAQGAASMPAMNTSNLDKKKLIITAAILAAIGFGAYTFLKKPAKEFSAANESSSNLARSNNSNVTEDLDKRIEQSQTVETPTNEQNKEENFNLGKIKTELFEELLESTKHENNDSDITEMQTAIRRLDQDISSNISQIRSIQNTLQDLSQSLQAINQNVYNIDRKLSDVTNNVNTVTDDVTGVKQIIADEDLDLTSQKVIDETITYTEPDYTVYAVVSGRAWLKAKNGNMVYVVEGDTLGKYGSVSNIDVVNHIVSTSSGTSFR